MTSDHFARRIFAPIGSSYELWARVLSLGQDGRWRRVMVDGLRVAPEGNVLDVAAGTGSITRLLTSGGFNVTAVDLTPEMIRHHPGPHRVLAKGEQLPFASASFEAITFGYLLRYVDDPISCLIELQRVVKPGGMLGMVEFGLPTGVRRILWNVYSGLILPAASRLIDRGWYQVSKFLKGSIEEFHDAHPNLEDTWRAAGLVDIKARRMSLGGGLVMWARRS